MGLLPWTPQSAPTGHCKSEIFLLFASAVTILQAELFTLLALATVAHSPILILANKQDCAEATTVAEISKALALTSIKSHDWHIQACCALTGEGLAEALEWISQKTAAAANVGVGAEAATAGQQSSGTSQQQLQQQQQQQQHKQGVQPVS
jgi:ribosomal protein L12E/L44/L45/RPP1/RPP2